MDFLLYRKNDEEDQIDKQDFNEFNEIILILTRKFASSSSSFFLQIAKQFVAFVDSHAFADSHRY
jgi:hypothetical protein